VEAIKAGISFFSTLRAGGDFDSLRKNLYVVPVIGAIIGVIISIPSIFLIKINAGFLIVVVYLAVEGINHIDGLSDFFDAVFAPPSRKLDALKDLNSGTGGSTAVTLYLIFLAIFFSKIDIHQVFFVLVVSQTLAKQSMLQLMLSMDPIWQGIASEFMKYRKKRDYCSYIFTITVVGVTGIIYPFQAIGSALIYTLITFGFVRYAKKNFGGINGDMIGAVNCIGFLGVTGVWTLLQL